MHSCPFAGTIGSCFFKHAIKTSGVFSFDRIFLRSYYFLHRHRNAFWGHCSHSIPACGSQYLYLVLGILMILGGLFFAGLISFGAGAIREKCENAVKRVKTLPSAFIFGVFFAFLEMPACPCCGAVLLLIASLIAIKGSLLYSGAVFFSFALGQSLPILVIGFSTSILKNLLPKTQYLEGVISFCVGNILIVSGIFLVTLA